MRIWMLTGLIAFSFGCTEQHEGKQSSNDPSTTHGSHGEKISAHNDNHSSHGGSAGHGEMNMSAVTRRVLKVQTDPPEPKAGSPVKLKLQIQGDDLTPIRTFDVVHEKLVHLIVVRDGLDEFAHLHPEVDATGNLTVDYVFPKSGTYRLFADHQPQGQSPGLATAELIIAGDDEPAVALVPDTSDEVTVGEINAHIAVTPGEHATMVRFQLIGLAGKTLTDLEPYLGAMGHLVIISADGRDYVHAHPLSEARTAPDGAVEFAAHFPNPGIYRIWGQFQHHGTVFTVPFTFEHVRDIME
ncbi:MAG: hypothetical protein H7Z17_04635 [Fuerstia sp.]|nr:hypothetical protein [Fuerstiella sp.]